MNPKSTRLILIGLFLLAAVAAANKEDGASPSSFIFAANLRYLACSTSALKAPGSLTAISASILRLMPILVFLKAFISRP